MMTTQELLKVAGDFYKPKTRAVRMVNDAYLANTVGRMSEAGYRFNDVTVEAVRAYLQGFGVLLSGKVGIGKTLFFRMINRDALIVDVGTIMGWKQTEIEDYIMNYRDCEIVLDDIGCGGSKARDYGREYDALLLVLNLRDPSRCKFRTHFTTNLTNDELVDNFDARVVDRIYGMAKCFRLPDGESMRDAFAF